MLQLKNTNQFKKDFKRMQQRGKDMKKLRSVITLIVNEKNQTLINEYNDHSLKGDYNDYRDCHIEPDWVLIYFIRRDVVTLVRTGSHSDLF